MRLRTATTFIVLVASAALAGPTPPAGQLIDVWIRPSGDAPRKPITIDLSTKPKTEVTRDDFQYEGMKAKTGQMMPFFKDLQKDDVVALHAWLTALTRARPVPYVAPVQN